jgi:hypothetical protein
MPHIVMVSNTEMLTSGAFAAPVPTGRKKRATVVPQIVEISSLHSENRKECLQTDYA